MKTDALVRDLKAIGINEGEVVLFHGSMKSLGPVEGGPDAVIDALQEAVGPAGTVAAPATIPAFQGPRDIYDAAHNPSEAGLLTETLRKRPDARRSRNQTHSVAVIGARAEELAAAYGAEPDRETPWGNAAFSDASPWGLLTRWNAQCLLLGVDFDGSPLLKYVQAFYLGRHQPGYARRMAYPNFDFIKMGRRIEARGPVRRGKVGQADAMLVRAGDLVQAALEILEAEPETVAPDPDFAYWLNHVKGRSLTLRGGVAAADFNIPGWPATGHGTSLKTRILYIEDEEMALAVVSLHLLALVDPDAWTVREAVGEALSLAPQQVFLCCTHLHSGPPTLIEGGLEDMILPHIIEACRSAAREAKAKAGPIRLGVAQREVEDFHWESRILLADGKSECIRRATPSTWRRTRPGDWDGGDYWLRPENDLDKTLTVLRIENAAGEPIGGLYHFACHPLPDFMGYAVDLVERVMGERFVCLMANGTLATVDVAFEIPRRGKVREGALPWLGEVFGYAVLETLARADVEDGGRIAMAREEVFLPMKPAFKAIQLGQYEGPPSSLARPQAIRGLARNLEMDGFPGEVQALTLGPLTLVGIPGEMAGEIGRRMTRGTNLSPTVVVGLANGEVAYIFPEESHRRGGYEVDPRCWSMTDGRAEMILRAAASKCLEKLEQAAIRHY